MPLHGTMIGQGNARRIAMHTPPSSRKAGPSLSNPDRGCAGSIEGSDAFAAGLCNTPSLLDETPSVQDPFVAGLRLRIALQGGGRWDTGEADCSTKTPDSFRQLRHSMGAGSAPVAAPEQGRRLLAHRRSSSCRHGGLRAF